MIDIAGKSKKEIGLEDNKMIRIASVKGIFVSKFRSFENRTVELGSRITVLSGRNGTMKTSLMGLIAHPFGGQSKDAFGRELKMPLKEVFKLSATYDLEPYAYSLVIETLDSEELLREEVKIYYTAEKTNRHRVVVSGAEKGDGNFNYNTSLLNLKRLLPLVDTNAKPDEDKAVVLSDKEKFQQKDFYEHVFPSTEYNAFTPIHHKGQKTTFAPAGEDARYDYESISSGEDNLGAIFNRLLGFQRAFVKGQKEGNGILCIDEFESGLHPVAQISLLKYLYNWSADYKVQVVITTHSLHLIQHIYLTQTKHLDDKRIIFNFVSCANAGKKKNFPILQNPEFNIAYKELTLENPEDVAQAQKIDVFCEDAIAVHYIKKLIKRTDILRQVSFHTNLNLDKSNNGTTYTSLANLCKNFSLLLQKSMVIFDADVAKTVTDPIKEKNIYLVLPDEDGLAIERRIIVLIISLEDDDKFFEYFKKEKMKFLQEFKNAGLSLSCADIKDEKKVKIDSCKKWAYQDIAEFKRYITYYCTKFADRDVFLKKFLERTNSINMAKGLPKIL
ncbi:AAA family ATPase [Janthinobacterium sp. J1-1]|uniref:AAA family ATPase n=1 Tax=Janthinobacterium sp. J1-1 TaxID=3065910 RepID=UPI0028116807|nr:AAA family ATPase [Janthinobacterium sp. J1-1]